MANIGESDAMSSGRSATRDEAVLEYTEFSLSARSNRSSDRNDDILSNYEAGGSLLGGSVQLDNIDYGAMGILNVDAAKSIRDDRSIPLKDRLKLWHAMLPTDFLNLLGSSGSKESCCLIHAESLIVHVVCSAEKEGNVLLDFVKGLQTLQLIYRIERILSTLLKCGGTFQLVFFDAFKRIFDPSYIPPVNNGNPQGDTNDEEENGDERQFFDGYLFLREILLTHVKLNGIPHLVFRDWYDSRWIQYINMNDPTCILLEDGSSFLYKYSTIYEIVDTPTKSKINTVNKEIVDDFNEQQKRIDRFTFATHALVINSLSSNVPVGYFFEIGPFAQNFKAFISFPSNCHAPKTLLAEVEECFREEYPIESESEHDDNVVPELIMELKGLSIEPRLRQLVACNYMKSLMQMKQEAGAEIDKETSLYIDSCVLTFKVLLIHNHLLDTLPLRARCTRRVNTEDWEFFTTYVAATLDLMASTTMLALTGISSVLDQVSNSKRDVADMFDGNLFTSLLQCMLLYAKEHGDTVDSVFLDLPENVLSDMDKVFSHLSGQSNARVFPIDMTAFTDCGIYDCIEAFNSLEQTEDNDVELLRLDNKFVNKYFGLTSPDSNIRLYDGDNSNCISKFNELGWRDLALFSEKTECIDYYLKAEVKDKFANLPKRTAKQEQRSRQRQTAFSHLVSRYLGSSNLHHPIVPKLDHHWLDVKLMALEAEQASAQPEADIPTRAKGGAKDKPVREKPTKDSKKDKPVKVKTSSKAELLRQKHTAAQENKNRENDIKTLDRFATRLPSLFSPEHDFDFIYTNILEYTSGPNRAVDLTGDFKWLKSIINTKPVQLQFLVIMIENLFTCFEGYRLRGLKGGKGACISFRRTICITIRLLHDCFNEYKALMEGPTVMLLQKFLLKLGMKRGAKNIFEIWCKIRDDKKCKQYKVESVEPFDFAVPKGLEYEFQLAYMGDWMERTLGSANDPRVLFKPDAWQKILLDVVDNRESALVVAPTSTGKTFICYYAMEQGLRLDDDGIVIFVSPNNALALQVTNEITARFSSKSYVTNVSALLSAEFLEKFHNPKWNCAQILVTVPLILEQLLMAMRTSELGYAKRIEYIILDEIHCLSSEDIGPFLERIIHLTAAPFLALSATVGNPTQFHQWLSKVERTRRNSDLAKVHYIYFDERFSDLKLECYSNRQLTPLNPATCLSYHNIKTNGMPKDLYLIPKDLMTFRRCINVVMGNGCPDLDYLDPSEYFKGSPIITKRQYRFWLHTFGFEFTRQVQSGAISSEHFDRIMDKLKWVNTSLSTALSDITDGSSDEIYRLYPLIKPIETISNVNTAVDEESLPQTDDTKSSLRDHLDPEAFLEMLYTMDRGKILPCLAFTFDRNCMEHIVISVTQLLMRKQWEKYYGTPEATAWTNAENKKRQDHYQMLMRQYEAEKKLRTVSREQREEQGIDGKVEDFVELPKEPVDVAEDYDPEFNFYNRKIYINYTDEIENFIKVAGMAISSKDNVDIFLEALRRGIGIHHEGLPHKFTMLTETLFRMGFIKVLLSGRSLAFGINVPCKSVIFLNDNHELTPLMYKQMSGRCGRRGFDLSGHVVFWDIPRKRIRQLLTAQLANLCGYSSCSPTEVLATLSAFDSLLVYYMSSPTQQNATGKISSTDARARKIDIITRSRDSMIDRRVIVKRLASIFMNPLKPHSSFSMDDVLVYRSCVEILFSLGLIDAKGSIRGCYGLALLTRDSHPSNLFLAYIAQLGILHGIKTEDEFAMRENLIHLLARFLYKRQEMGTTLTLRRLLSQGIRCGAKHTSTLTTNLKHTNTEFASMALAHPDFFPLLPAASDDIRRVIMEYNEKVLAVLSKYQAKLTSTEQRLPLSNVDFACHVEERPCWFHEARRRLVFESLSSPFVGINGLDGNFKTARELWLSARSGSDMTFDMIPTIESVEVDVVQLDTCYNVLKQLPMTLDNSYVIDYWTHGKFSYIRDINGLGQYAWFHLRKIVTFLKLLKMALGAYTNDGTIEDPVHDAVKRLSESYETKFSCI